jgi:hypothetical protein
LRSHYDLTSSFRVARSVAMCCLSSLLLTVPGSRCLGAESLGLRKQSILVTAVDGFVRTASLDVVLVSVHIDSKHQVIY